MKPFVALLLCASVCYAQILGSFSDLPFFSSSSVPCPDHATYLIKQGFEGTGYDNCETWTQGGAGTVDENYTGIVLAGAQSMRIALAANDGWARSPTFTDHDEVWGYFLLRPVVHDASFVKTVASFKESASQKVAFQVNTDRTLRVAMNTIASTVAQVSVGTTYHVWIYYKKGTGADAIGSIAFSTDGIKPTSGNNFAQISNGNITTTIDQIELVNVTATMEYIFDNVRVSTNNIGDNPP